MVLGNFNLLTPTTPPPAPKNPFFGEFWGIFTFYFISPAFFNENAPKFHQMYIRAITFLGKKIKFIEIYLDSEKNS